MAVHGRWVCNSKVDLSSTPSGTGGKPNLHNQARRPNLNCVEAHMDSKHDTEDKNFALKMMTNFLAVRLNLVRRQMNVSPCCPMCGMNKDTEYTIYRCRWTNAVWFRALGLTYGHKGSNTIGT